MKINEIENVRESAGCLIFAANSERFLFIQRSNAVSSPLTWSIPGGGVDPGETPAQGMIRETLEEAGHDISQAPHELLMITKNAAPRTEYHVFVAIVPVEFKPTLNWESNDHVWCTLDQLPTPVHRGIKLLLANDAAGKTLHEFIRKYQTQMS
jgi:8-oxo-dGTP pyrophosphatase MutT (NUDIX family)